MDNLKINTVPQKKISRILQIFEMMSLVAQNPDNFNPENHCEVGSEQYEILDFYFIKATRTFHYKLFLAFCMNEIGENFKNIVQGYEILIEKYGPSDMSFLKTDLAIYYKSLSNN